jgi:hypothetical protein
MTEQDKRKRLMEGIFCLLLHTMNKKKPSEKKKKVTPGIAKEKLNVSVAGNPMLNKPKKRRRN